MSGKVQAVPILHLSPLQVEILSGPSAGMVIPSIGEQNAADIHKQRCDRDRSFHSRPPVGNTENAEKGLHCFALARAVRCESATGGIDAFNFTGVCDETPSTKVITNHL